MDKAKEEKQTDGSAKEKIVRAARKIFMQKGYAAARNRDIADEAGINMAMLNYYFHSKEKLFQLVMTEKLQQFFDVVLPIANNEALSLEEKLKVLVENYINLLVGNPDLPIFLISEVRANPDKFREKVHVRDILKNSSFVRQIREKRPGLDPVHFVVSILGMIIFPFVAKAVLFPDEGKFNAMMEERKTLIAQWTKAMLEA